MPIDELQAVLCIGNGVIVVVVVDRRLEKMVGHENRETAYVVTQLICNSARRPRPTNAAVTPRYHRH